SLKVAFTATLTAQTGPTSFRLADGQHVRLADIHLQNASSTALEGLVGERLALAPTGHKPNRYGAIPVHAFQADKNDSPKQETSSPTVATNWIQAELVENGRAVVDPEPLASPAELKIGQLQDHATCVRALIAREPPNALPMLDARQTTVLHGHIGRFVAVTGHPTRISSSRGRTFVNFGKDWKSDTTIAIPNAVNTAFPDWTASLHQLKGRTIIVRGWLEARRGPLLTLSHPTALQMPSDQPNKPTTKVPPKVIIDAIREQESGP
ncbi:MAG: hypothetical protein AAFR75_09350, partial [Pseudomonadota bacterium]